VVGRSARNRRQRAGKSKLPQIQAINEDIDHSDRIVLGNIVFKTGGGDLDLLRLKTYGTIGIMSPIDFLNTLEGFKKAA